ncbi:hypothetical protein [Lacrimispora indolis]|uniref:hypothetical protein n=1 Tax=Lacrimispora indolis TaxID=69825 RepID=UPI00045E79E4|nr:hypothetical protein [Lacrimispora indolis]
MKQIKSIYLRNIYGEIMKRKKLLLAFVLLSALVFAAVGYQKGADGAQLSEEQEKKVQDYQNTIADYDNTISELDQSLELVQKQIDQLQEYVDHSIYMKLDYQNIYAASAQFAISNTGGTGNVLNSFTYFINEGGLLSGLSEEYGDVDARYLKEIIMCSTGSNILNITVYHQDEDQAKKLLESIEKLIDEQTPVIAKTQGAFTIQEISSSSFTKADVNVANTQNSNTNNLKNFLNNKVDLENKRISQVNGKSSYIEKNETKINAIAPVNPFKEGMKFAVTGAVFGILILWCFYSIKYILGNSLKSKEDLLSANLPVIATYSSAKGYLPSLDRTALDIQLWSEQYQMSGIFINALSEDELAKKVVGDYKDRISQLDLSVDTGGCVNDDAGELRNMINAKYSIMIVQAGKTSYSQISEQIGVCEKFGVKILGYVVVE